MMKLVCSATFEILNACDLEDLNEKKEVDMAKFLLESEGISLIDKLEVVNAIAVCQDD